jgi:hypothetical protein
MARLVAASAMCVVLAGCWWEFGVSQQQAIELALRGAPEDAQVMTVERAELGMIVDANLLPNEPRDRVVWLVGLTGTFGGECVVDARGDSVCAMAAESQLVVLDAQTGELLYTESPAP